MPRYKFVEAKWAALRVCFVFGTAGLFLLFDQQLLVDQIAQDVFFAFGVDFVGVGGILLFDLIAKLIFAVLKLRAGNNPVIHPGNNFFDNLRRGKSGQARQNRKQQTNPLHKLHWYTHAFGTAGKGRTRPTGIILLLPQ